MIQAFVLLAAAHLGGPVLIVHASPRGRDENPGTRAAPVRTLARAIQLSRRRGASTSARVVLAPGDYEVGATLDLGPNDGRLVLEGAGKARLLGGKVVRGWRGVTDPAVRDRLAPPVRAKVVEVDLAQAGLTPGELRPRGFHDASPAAALELFFDGRPMHLARWPNAGEGAAGGWAKVAARAGEKGFVYEGDRPRNWGAPNDPWIFGYLRFDWCDTSDRVVRLDPSSRTVELGRAPDYGIDAKRRFYFFNVLEELDAPGEYFVDRRAGKLYFLPPSPIAPADLAKADVVASEIEGPLLRVRNAADVRIRGLRLEGGREGAIRVEGGEGVRVESCLIRNFGTYGVSIRNARDSGVAHCDLTGLGTRGIELIGGDRKTLTPAGLYAEDDHVWAYSRGPRTYQAGIAIEGVGNRASHNRIEDAPHNAILLSGNDHAIEYNDVRRVCLETGDSGAVYMGHDLTMRGNRIRFNRFRDIVPTVNTEGAFTNVMSVYLDDQWCGTTISGNVFEGRGTGILIGGGRDNVVEHNVFVGKDPAFHIDERGKDWAKDKAGLLLASARELNVDRPPYSVRYPRLAKLFGEDAMAASGNAFVGNVVVGKRPFWFQNGLSERSLDFRDNALLPEGTLAEALKRAPVPIPLGKMGLTTKARPFGGAR